MTPIKTTAKISGYVIRSAAAALLLLGAQVSLAASATWLLSPQDSAWENANNWTPGGPPNGPSDIATFAQSSQTNVNISTSEEVNSIVFASGSAAYVFSIGACNGASCEGQLVISGTGVNNNSSVGQNFQAANLGQIIFNGASAAASAHMSIVNGAELKKVVIRAIGPSLTQYGVPNPLLNPTLELHDGTGALIASNDNWGTTIIGGIITSDQVAAIRASGYAPDDLRESAMIVSVPPGNYTAIVRGVDNTIGIALVEVYDLSPAPNSILGNISTRSFVRTGDNVMIGGVIVQGTEPRRVIVRAIGPELTQYGVPNTLADPTLELHDSTGALIASNNNWQHTIIGGIITSSQVQDIINSAHAPGDPRESAIIADLPPGNYTAIVRGVNNTTGVALVEVYDLH
jgi:hypothetical protein